MPNNQTETTRPSITAAGIIGGFYRALATGYHQLFSKEELQLSKHMYCTAIKSFPPLSAERISLEALWWVPYKYQQGFFNKMVIPAYDQVVMLRKLMIRQQINEAIKNGLEQLVIVGGGYSTEGFVTAFDNPKLKVFELDRGPTRNAKISSLNNLPGVYNQANVQKCENDTIKINENLFYISCDLATDNLNQKLLDNGYDVTKKTLILAEGLTAYLTEEQNHHLLQSINEISSPDSLAIIGYINKGISDGTAKQLQEANGEGHFFAPEPSAAFGFSKANGFCITGKFNYVDVLPTIGHNIDAQLYRENQKHMIEFYYKLEKGPSLNKFESINEVPVIEVQLGNDPLPDGSSYSCNIL